MIRTKSVLVAANDNSMIKISKVNIETYKAEILGGVPSQLDNLVQYDIVQQQFSIVVLQN